MFLNHRSKIYGYHTATPTPPKWRNRGSHHRNYIGTTDPVNTLVAILLSISQRKRNKDVNQTRYTFTICLYICLSKYAYYIFMVYVGTCLIHAEEMLILPRNVIEMCLKLYIILWGWVRTKVRRSNKGDSKDGWLCSPTVLWIIVKCTYMAT